MALTRAAINAFATHCGKLKPEVVGNALPKLKWALEFQPNPYQDTYKFLYRVATIFKVHNTAFIAPLLDDNAESVIGYYPLLPTQCEIVESENGDPFLRYTFSNGTQGSVPLDMAGIMTQFQYKSDFFGESNRAFDSTMQLINAQNQAIIEGAKNSAAVRFIVRTGTVIKDEALAEERKKFVKANFTAENNGGAIFVDGRYADVKQIESKPYLISSAQMQAIKENVFDYFGVNDDILHNSWDENKWAAFYEGAIEPFALQLGLTMTNMTFSGREKTRKNQIYFSSNRLQYASTETKLSVVTQMFDRGMFTPNQGLEVFNMPPRNDDAGDKYYIRKEYAEVNKLDAGVTDPPLTPTETPTEREQNNAAETE